MRRRSDPNPRRAREDARYLPAICNALNLTPRPAREDARREARAARPLAASGAPGGFRQMRAPGAPSLWRVLCAALLLTLALLPLRAHAEAPESRILYVYITACESCARAGAVIDALPERVEAKTAGGTVSSAVTVEKLNLIDDVPRVQALFEACGVPEDARVAPAVFFGGECLVGADAIEDGLLPALADGRALAQATDADAPPAKAADASTGAGIAGAALAGLVGGLNPCALSMLLLFLAQILSVRAHAGRYAAAFLGSKFACYLLIGTAFLGAFRAWNPTWLPLAARIAMTALAAGLAALNLSDAWHARRERYGEIRNQLPTGVRRFLNGYLRDLPRRGGRFLLAATLLTGAVVALSEFLCAGQIYLAVLLAALEQPGSFARALPPLIAYCAAFLAPSAALAAAMIAGKSAFSAGDWLKDRLPLIKLLSALALVAIAAAMWILA